MPLVRLRGISKAFGSVRALAGVDLDVRAGEVHALLGENGAGKSTLMHVLYGLLRADEGTVEVRGVPLAPGSVRAAMDAGLGLVQQHFAHVARMSVAENCWLGRPGFAYDRGQAVAAVRRASAMSGLAIDPDALAGDLPVGLQQRLEILKALTRDARVLVLDEPTGALAPPEVETLFEGLRQLRARGLGIVLITHKLREVAMIADRVTVLRQGAVVLAGEMAAFDRPALARAMVGESAGEAELAEVEGEARGADAPDTRARGALEVRDLTVRVAGRVVVDAVSLDVRSHEIVGIAAVEGNGQRELLRAIAGLLPYEGTLTAERSQVGFIPEDRQHEGLILDFDLPENVALGEPGGFFMSRGYIEGRAAVAIDEYGIKVGNPRLPVSSLSGGNQQKVVIARALGRRPSLLVAENPTRGLDIRATADVHALLRRAARQDGLGVLFHSTDLDEVLALSDRIGIMIAGRWRWVDTANPTREALGALMLGAGA